MYWNLTGKVVLPKSDKDAEVCQELKDKYQFTYYIGFKKGGDTWSNQKMTNSKYRLDNVSGSQNLFWFQNIRTRHKKAAFVWLQ